MQLSSTKSNWGWLKWLMVLHLRLLLRWEVDPSYQSESSLNYNRYGILHSTGRSSFTCILTVTIQSTDSPKMSRNSFLIKMCLLIETKSWDILLFIVCRLVKLFFFIQIHWSNKFNNYCLPANCSDYRIYRVSQTTPTVSVALNMSPHESLLQLQRKPPHFDPRECSTIIINP